MNELSKRAESALLAAGASRAGAKVGWSSPAALTELENAGLITRNHYLSQKGATRRDALVSARLDEAFGE